MLGEILCYCGVEDKVKTGIHVKMLLFQSIAKTTTESTFGGSNGVVVELVDPRVVGKEITEKIRKTFVLYNVWGNVGSIVEVILKSFSGTSLDPKTVRQNGAECGKRRARCGRMQAEYGRI